MSAPGSGLGPGDIFDKDISTLWMRPTCNQVMYITTDKIMFHTASNKALSSNLDYLQSNLNGLEISGDGSGINGGFPRIMDISSNEITMYRNLIPYTSNMIDIGSINQPFQTISTKRIFVQSNLELRKNEQDMLEFSGVIDVPAIKIENKNDYLPVGSILPYAGISSTGVGGTSPPPGYLWCDGSEIAIATYGTLYRVLSNMYGVPVNPSNFKVPDFRGRSPFGAIGFENMQFGLCNNSLYNYGGSELITLASCNLPAHTHRFVVKAQNQPVPQGTYGMVRKLYTTAPISINYGVDAIGAGVDPQVDTNDTATGFDFYSCNVGTSTPFTAVHPVLVTNFIIKY